MKTFGKAVIVFLLFTVGTLSMIHVDRQCMLTSGGDDSILSAVENIIEE